MLSKGEQTRAEIMDAAKRLFLTQGYSGTSMRDIAEAAGGRQVSGIYNHFKSKEAIFQALIAERNPYPEIVSAIENTSGSTAPEYITNILRVVMPIMTNYADFIDLVQIDAREFQGANVGNLLQTTILPRVLQLAGQFQSLPGLKPLEPIALIRMIASTVIGYVLTQRFMPALIRDTLTPKGWIDFYIDTLLHGIVKED